jgi:anaerobic dimethyl sulfoxide reductase subunit C (anchor subunit)
LNTREWALVAFTLLMQASVGILLVVVALQLFAAREPAHAPARALDGPLLGAAAAAVFGLVASLAHLGQPAQAWLAITNVRTSWLSREVVLTALFTASALLVVALDRTGAGSPGRRDVARVVAAVLGVAVVFAMSRLYMVPAQPGWNRVLTPINFFATTVLLGAVVLLVASSVRAATQAALPEHRLLIMTAIVLLALQVLLLPAEIAVLAREPAAAISPAAVGHAATWLALGKAAAAIAAGLLLVGVLRGVQGPLSPVTIGVATLVLVAVSEILGRVLFYASSVRLGPI